eukprot:3186169-Prymnesium_polylepis.2
MPDGGNAALLALEVSFSLSLDEQEFRLRVRFEQGYPLLGTLPAFELVASDAQLPTAISTAVVAAAEAAVETALEEGDGNAVYAALGASREALEAFESGAIAESGSRTQQGAAGGAGGTSGEQAVPSGAGAWAVLGACGRPLYDVLVAWDVQRSGTASRAGFRQAAQALAALGICARAPTNAELDAMYTALCEGQSMLPLARLLQPLDVAADLIERRLQGIQCRTWREIDKWADETSGPTNAYNWYTAARELRRNPAMWRDAPSSRTRNLFDADRQPHTTLHLFAADEGNWGEGGHLVSLAACALLLVDRHGRGAARLTQLSVNPSAASDDFDWEERIIDAADLLAEQQGHLWVSVSAARGSAWEAALLARGYRPHHLPDSEPDASGRWLIKATPLRDSVAA